MNITHTVVDFLNLIAFNLNPRFNWGSASNSFVREVLGFTTLSIGQYVDSYSVYLVVFWIVGSIITLSLAASIIVSIAFQRNKFNGILPLIHGLNFYSTIAVAVFIPFLSVFLHGLNCKYLDTNVPYLVSFPSQSCWSVVTGIHTGIGALFMICFILYTAAFTSVYFDPSPTSRELLSRPHSKFEMVFLSSKVILAVSAGVLSSRLGLLAVVNFLCSSAVLISCLFFSCYFSKKLNFLRAGLSSAIWFSSAVLLAVVRAPDDDPNRDRFTIVLLVGIVPFFCLGYLTSWLRLRQLNGSRLFAAQLAECVARSSPPASVSSHGRSSASDVNSSIISGGGHSSSFAPTFAPEAVQPNLNIDVDFKYDHEYEICTRFVLEDPRFLNNPQAVSIACGILEAGIRKFPHSVFLLMAYSSFFHHVVKDTARASVLVSKAASLQPPFYIRYQIYARQKHEETLRQGDMDLVQLVAFQKSYKTAKENHSRCVKSIRYLWKNLLPSRVDVLVLPTIMERIYFSQTKAEEAFSELFTKFRNSPRVLRSYACFLEDVLLNHALAARYFEVAEEAEEAEASRQTAASKVEANAALCSIPRVQSELMIPMHNDDDEVIDAAATASLSSPSMLCLTLDKEMIIRKVEGGAEVVHKLFSFSRSSSSLPLHVTSAPFSASLSLFGSSFTSLLSSSPSSSSSSCAELGDKIWNKLQSDCTASPNVFRSCFISIRGSISAWISLLFHSSSNQWIVRLAIAPISSVGTLIVFENDIIASCDPSISERIGFSEEFLWEKKIDFIVPNFSPSEFARTYIPRVSSASSSSSSSASSLPVIADLNEDVSVTQIVQFHSSSGAGELIPAQISVQKIRVAVDQPAADAAAAAVLDEADPSAGTHHAILINVSFLQLPDRSSIAGNGLPLSPPPPHPSHPHAGVGSSALAASPSSAHFNNLPTVASVLLPSSPAAQNLKMMYMSNQQQNTSALQLTSIADMAKNKSLSKQAKPRKKSSVGSSSYGGSLASSGGSRKRRRSLSDDDFTKKVTLTQSLHRMMLFVLAVLLTLAVVAFAVSRNISESLASSLVETGEAAIIASLTQDIPLIARGSWLDYQDQAKFEADRDQNKAMTARFDYLSYKLYNTDKMFLNSELYNAYFDKIVLIYGIADAKNNFFIDYRSVWETSREISNFAQKISRVPFANATAILPNMDMVVLLTANAINFMKAFQQFVQAWTSTSILFINQSKQIESALLLCCLSLSFFVAFFVIQRALNRSHKQRVKCFGHLISIPRDICGKMLEVRYHILEEEDMEKAAEAEAIHEESGGEDADDANVSTNSSDSSAQSPAKEFKAMVAKNSNQKPAQDAMKNKKLQPRKTKRNSADLNSMIAPSRRRSSSASSSSSSSSSSSVSSSPIVIDVHSLSSHPACLHSAICDAVPLQSNNKPEQLAAESSDHSSPNSPNAKRFNSLHSHSHDFIPSSPLASPSFKTALRQNGGQQNSLRSPSRQVRMALMSIPLRSKRRSSASSSASAGRRRSSSSSTRSSASSSAPSCPSVKEKQPSSRPSVARDSDDINHKGDLNSLLSLAARVSATKSSKKSKQLSSSAPQKLDRAASLSDRRSLSFVLDKSKSAAASTAAAVAVVVRPSLSPVERFKGWFVKAKNFASAIISKALGNEDDDDEEMGKNGKPLIDKKLASLLMTSRMKNLIRFGWFLILCFCSVMAITLALRLYMLQQVERVTYEEAAVGELYTRVSHARFIAREFALNCNNTVLRAASISNYAAIRAIRIGLVEGDSSRNLNGHADKTVPGVSEILYSEGCKLFNQALCPLPSDPEYSDITAGLDLTLFYYMRKLRYMNNAVVYTLNDASYTFMMNRFQHIADPIFQLLQKFSEFGIQLIDDFESIQVLLFLASLTIIALLYFSFTKRMIAVTTEERNQIASLLAMIPEEEAAALPWLDEFLSI